LVSVEQYVRGLQRLGETDPKDRSKLDPNTKTVEPQTPRTWAGLDFRELIMSIHMPDGTGTHYMGVTCTHLKSYVLCFQGHAGSVEMVRALLKLDQKLEIAPMKPVKSMSRLLTGPRTQVSGREFTRAATPLTDGLQPLISF
jgi:hypothetical protein